MKVFSFHNNEWNLAAMEMPDWPRWFSNLLIVLLLLLLGWLGARWLDIRAEDWMPGMNTPLQERYQELTEQQDSMRGSWLRTLNPTVRDVQGGLVWSSAEQEGVMQLINLPDPQRGFQYHIWIYDSWGDTAVPISGGILQQGSGKREQFITVTPAKPIVDPYKFEMTLESVDKDSDEEPQVVLMVQL